MSKNKTEEILQEYREVYKEVNGKDVEIRKSGRWYWLNYTAYTILQIQEFTENLKKRLEERKLENLKELSTQNSEERSSCTTSSKKMPEVALQEPLDLAYFNTITK